MASPRSAPSICPTLYSTTPRRTTPSACAAPEPEDDASAGAAPQGPAAPAPTQAGVSTAGMDAKDAALLEACYDADVAAIDAAIDAGGSALARDLNRRSPLHFCAGNGLGTIVKRLTEGGADLDAQDMLGLTPLHMATGYRKAGTVQGLVELGADANVACYGGELPVELAERLLAATPKRKFLLPNAEWDTLKEIVNVLDEATEEEEADDEDEEAEEAKEMPVAVVPGAAEESEGGGAKFVVRVKEKKPDPAAEPVAAAMPPAPAVPIDVSADVKVTVRKRGDDAAAEARPQPPATGDVEVVVRRPGEKKV